MCRIHVYLNRFFIKIIVFNTRGAVTLISIIRPLLIIIAVTGLFFFYNLFLVDRSLESLKFSLSTVAGAETVGSVSYLAPLMQIQFIEGLSSAELDTKDLMRLQYSADVIGTSRAERKIADVASIMQEIINKKEQERNIILRFFDKVNSFLISLFKKESAWRIKRVKDLNIDSAVLEDINSYENRGELDKAIKLYRDTIAKFPDYIQTPTLILRLGFLLHKLGRFEEAGLLYGDDINRFPNTTESRVARELMDLLEKIADLNEKSIEAASKISAARDKATKQKLYYEQGLVRLSVLDLQKAKDSFRRAALILPDTDITTQSYLRLGICERLLGDLDASLTAFKKAGEIAKNAELKAQSKYQVAQSYRQKGDYKEATSTLDDIAEEEKDKDIKSLLLFQKGSTILYDERDLSRAKQVFDELMRRYSAHALASPGGDTSFVDFVKKHVDLNILARKPEELEKLLEKAWVEALLPKKILNIIEANSTRVINSLNSTVGGVAKLREQALEEGAYVQVELTESEINNFIRSSISSAGSLDLSEISVDFEGDQKLTIDVTLRQGQKPIKVIVSGEFKVVGVANAPHWISATARRNLLIFLAEKCKIGNIPIPPDIINPLFRPAFENFNESFPLDIEEFKLDRNTMIFSGKIRKDFISRLKTTPTTSSVDQMSAKRLTAGFLSEGTIKKLRRKEGF